MFTSRKDNSIRTLGETRLIGQIRTWLGTVAPPSPLGMGDDCAVVEPAAARQLLTTDSLSYGVHFDDAVSARAAGAKLVKRNLSDIAAMGGEPRHALLSLLTGGNLRLDWLEDFIGGVRDACERYGVSVLGGDVSALPDGQFSGVLSLTGETIDTPLLRSGAHADEAIYVSGSLGGSLASRHHSFEPRLAEGQWLARSDICSALMDLTDGLAKDLRELIPAGCAAHLELSKIPIAKDVRAVAKTSGKDPLEHAFCDGEDYELLFTVQHDVDLQSFERSWSSDFPNTPLTRIGWLRASTGGSPYLDADTKEALPWQQGFEHLKGQ